MQPINIGCLNKHGYIGCLNKHGSHVTANYSTNNNVVFFFRFSFENIVYYKNYSSSITMSWTRVEKLFCVEIKIIKICLKIDTTY